MLQVLFHEEFSHFLTPLFVKAEFCVSIAAEGKELRHTLDGVSPIGLFFEHYVPDYFLYLWSAGLKFFKRLGYVF